jgi:hypothetical protein
VKLTLKIIALIFSLTFCLVAIAFGIVVLWAATGPRDLSKYNSFIESSINSVMESGKVSIGSSSLQWGGADELLVINAKDVMVLGSDGAVTAKLPEIDFQYNVLSLFTGSLIPSNLTLVGPELRMDTIFSSGSDNSFDLTDIDTSKVREINIVNGKLTLLQQGQVWEIKTATAEFHDNAAKINVNLSPSASEAVNISGDASFRDGSYSVVAALSNFNTDNLKYYMPYLNNINMVLNGAVGMTGNAKNVAPDKVQFELPSFSGVITDDEHLRGDLNIKVGQLNGSYDHNSKAMNLKWLGLEFDDGTKIGLEGQLADFKTITLTAAVDNLKPENMYKYWPKNTADNANDWVRKNISGGLIKEGTAKLDMDLDDMASTVMDFRFKFYGLNVKYHDDLMPATALDGFGIMDVDGLKLTVDTGVLGQSKIAGTEILIDNFTKPVQKFSLNGTVAGSAADIADFYVKLGKGRKIIDDAKNISGLANTKLTISFPLLADLLMKDVKLAIETSIKSGQISGAYGVANLSDIAMDLKMKNDDYAVKGTAISDINKPSETIKFGRTPTVFEVQNSAGVLGVSAALDLSSSEINIPALNIKKPAGDGAKLLFKSAQGQGNPQIQSLDFKSDQLNFSAVGELTAAYDDVAALQFSQLQFGKTSMIGKLTTSPYVNAEFKADTLDLAPILKHISESEDEKNSSFIARFSADKILMAGEESYPDAKLAISCNEEICGNLQFESGDTKIDLNPSTLTIASNDAGKFLRAFDIYENMKGGKLSASGNVSGNNYDGEFKVLDFNILKAKTLAKMLTLGSLSGIADALSGKGISFKKLASKFKMTKKKLEIDDYRMVGNAIGITASGNINRKTDVADLSGNIIPAYTANTLLGKIPLIGDVLIGNDGVFALAYKLTGKTDDPEISVNPLSVLAPGFLKKVFE